MQEYARNYRQRRKHDSEINLSWIGDYNVFKDEFQGQRSKSLQRNAEESRVNFNQHIVEQKSNLSSVQNKCQGIQAKQALYGYDDQSANNFQTEGKRSKSQNITSKISEIKPCTYQSQNQVIVQSSFGDLKREKTSMYEILNKGLANQKHETQAKAERNRDLDSVQQIKDRDRNSNIFNIDKQLDNKNQNSNRER